MTPDLISRHVKSPATAQYLVSTSAFEVSFTAFSLVWDELEDLLLDGILLDSFVLGALTPVSGRRENIWRNTTGFKTLISGATESRSFTNTSVSSG
ncbi:hypothetical protein soil367_08420 [Hydrocarboniclastica marina]|uniref:Uncharacterized protein n=1 Tax=Hydrocarboniclastica marina TaxID=2259620 RepID=A0A4P7XG40_9ALTE|nr:hypothetical protein soil367_08420 [Hydrocarboniclastica marina]